ncbi:hypothetical protein PHJA_001702600 [Phtheirospermum japonicum]|uniref:Uncharacterized protein n=1 Tax=Phtheirospermum japonicum TaxID=374723 RepID=A0A830CIA7_9LAMI|nr:hypothetical protein PHJA_001702600 [Phtheirospermum japonicum]
MANRTQQRETTRPYSQRGGWHYWQRPSGKNAAGTKRRPAPGEHIIFSLFRVPASS